MTPDACAMIIFGLLALGLLVWQWWTGEVQ